MYHFLFVLSIFKPLFVDRLQVNIDRLKAILNIPARGIKSMEVIISRKLMANVIDAIAPLPANIYYLNGALFSVTCLYCFIDCVSLLLSEEVA